MELSKTHSNNCYGHYETMNQWTLINIICWSKDTPANQSQPIINIALLPKTFQKLLFVIGLP